ILDLVVALLGRDRRLGCRVLCCFALVFRPLSQSAGGGRSKKPRRRRAVLPVSRQEGSHVKIPFHGLSGGHGLACFINRQREVRPLPAGKWPTGQGGPVAHSSVPATKILTLPDARAVPRLMFRTLLAAADKMPMPRSIQPESRACGGMFDAVSTGAVWPSQTS